MATKSLNINKSTSETHNTGICDVHTIQEELKKAQKNNRHHHISWCLCTVSKAGFQKMIQTLDKRYQVPSLSCFSRISISEMYTKCKASVEFELKQVKYYATISDMRSSRTSEPYMSLSVHFISDYFEMKIWCLQKGILSWRPHGRKPVSGFERCFGFLGSKCQSSQIITQI